MPCYDDRIDIDRKETKERLDKVTRVACEMGSYFSSEELEMMSEETQKWYMEHAFEDWKRRR